MKKKFSSMWRVAIALVMVLSLNLVAAVPAVADTPADTDVGFKLGGHGDDTAEWSDAKKDAPGAKGNYSVLLENITTDGDNYVQLIPPSVITFADFQTDIAGAGDKWSFWDYAEAKGEREGAQFWFLFEDPASSDSFDMNFVQHDFTGTETWLEVIVDKDEPYFQYWGPLLGSSGANKDFTALLAHNTDKLGNGDYDLYQLTWVRVEIWHAEAEYGWAYIDDITIAGTTYELEPIFLDAEYYSVGDTVVVTVPNFAANTDSIRVNPVAGEPGESAPYNWSVTATSTSDTSGITVDLEETGINTGVFTGNFATTGTTPAGEDELYVEDSDTITIVYGVAGTLTNWGAANELSYTSIEASVDDSAPTISALSPADGATLSNRTPDIGATYDTVPTNSVELIFNGVDVTDDTTVATTSVSYTPEDDLADGTYEVTLNIEDDAGNTATETWSFSVASWLEGSPVSSTTGDDSLDKLDTVGVAVSGATDDDSGQDITVGRYASNPQPETTPTFDMIDDGFFDVKVEGADTATQIVIKFADANITADSTAYVWSELEGAWLECSDQGYNPTDEFLWVKVRTIDTTPNISELTGTPFVISGEAAVSDISDYYKDHSGDAEVVETTDLLKAANDWANEVVPSGFTEAISTTQLLGLANEWAAN